MVVIIIETTKYIRGVYSEDYDTEAEEVIYQYSPVRYDSNDLEQALGWYIDDCNEAYSEFNALSFKVHQILVYNTKSSNETPHLITDMTPYKKHFEQIECYDWSGQLNLL